MENKFDWKKFLLRSVSYILVAALASALTLFVFGRQNGQYGKLTEIKNLISRCFIGEMDEELAEDMMAAALVASTEDPWSYYIPAQQVQEFNNHHTNSYVGIGVTILILEDGSGFAVQKVEPGSPAAEGGMEPGDRIVAVNGKYVRDVGAETAQNMIAGEAGSQVSITVLRDTKELQMNLTRKNILTQVASGRMLTESVGYIKINNFNSRCAQDAIALFEDLEEQGAKAMIFDVRFNGGGYVSEMVTLLDYLLPEGVLFRSEDYTGRVSEERSDASCKEMPMAVLINGDSVSAAEFFPAALSEYGYAVTVGEPTYGKGHFQQTFTLSDGSAVNLSVGKYFTPKGVNLAEAGGLQPDELVPMDEEMENLLYSEMLSDEEDIQLQAALKALTEPELKGEN